MYKSAVNFLVVCSAILVSGEMGLECSELGSDGMIKIRPLVDLRPLGWGETVLHKPSTCIFNYC